MGFAAGFTFFLHPMTSPRLCRCSSSPHFEHVGDPHLLDPGDDRRGHANLGFLVWNVKNNWLSLAVPPANDTYTERLPRIFSGLIPRAVGLMNTNGTWTLGAFSVVLYVIVLACSAVGVITLLRRSWHGAVIAIPALLVWPMLAGLSSTWFVADGRYAIVGFPQLVMVTVFGLHTIARQLQSMINGETVRHIGAALPASFAVIWIVAGGIFWLRANAGPAVDDPNARMRAVTELLESESINYAAGNYWHVQPVEYLSGGDIHVAVAGHPWGHTSNGDRVAVGRAVPCPPTRNCGPT